MIAVSVLVIWNYHLRETHGQPDGNFITYMDPKGLHSLQYPSDWEVEYIEPLTKFNNPVTEFKPYGGSGSVFIEVGKSVYKNFKDFQNKLANLTSSQTEVVESGLNVYNISGYPTYSLLAEKEGYTKFILTPYIDSAEMVLWYAGPTSAFEQDFMMVEKIIESIQVIRE